MRLKLKVAVVALGALLLVGMFAQSAFATSPQVVALQVGDAMGSGYAASYGQEIDLIPTVLSAIERPKDTFSFQTYVTDSDGVQKWLDITDFEPIALEDTNTVPPFGFRMGYDGIVSLSDFSTMPLTYPAMIRCTYKPLGANTTPTVSVSETETIDVVKNASEKVTFSTTGTVKHAGTKFNFHVTPNAGVGTIKVTVKKSGKTLTYNVATDADSKATTTLKLGASTGTYSVAAKFLGNQWGPASGTTTKNVVAAH
jgi:hypothetical protein